MHASKKPYDKPDRGVEGVHVSSIVNEAIRANSNFLRKTSTTQKTQNK